MMSYKCDTVWPMRIDLSSLECRQILREKELLCYSDVVSVLRAQGPLSEEKKSVLTNLQKILSISDERNKAELRRAANNEKLATIAENVSGFDAYTEWAALGTLKFPPTERPTPRTIYCDQASQTSIYFTMKEKDFPSPSDTHDSDLAEKHEAAILTNRIINKDRRPVKTEATTKSFCSTLTMTDINKLPNQDLFKSNPSKDSSTTSHDYNLHLLSEIATGESTQSDLATDPIIDSNIKPDSFSIQNQIHDIEQGAPPIEPSPSLLQSRSVLLPPSSSNVVIGCPIKSLNANIQEIGQSGNVPMVISNHAGQRYVLPRNSLAQSINLIATNQPKNQVTSFLSQPQPGGGYLTLSAGNQLRSPPAHQLNASWTGPQGQSQQQQQQQQQQPQQVYIQNVSSHHGLNLQQNAGDYANSLGYALKQRAITQQTAHTVNNKLVVRNLGSQAATDSERNKRFMVLKGNTGTGSMGPSTKKPKISNPSNRQPGRPPLMPAPSSAYTSRPYVANEIFHNSRAINTVSSISDTSATTDSNGLKISSISSASRGAATNSSQVRSSPYYSVNRGNGLQRINSSSNSSVVQLGSGPQLLAMDTSVGGVGANSLRPKNIQPVISVVPLSPRGLTTTESVISSNVSILGNSIKDNNNDHNVMDKDSNTSFKIITKDEVYANLMDRMNPSMVSLSQTENKIQ